MKKSRKFISFLNLFKKLINYFKSSTASKSCFQPINIKSVENVAGQQNIVTQQSNIYDHFYISKDDPDPFDIFNNMSCLDKCSAYPLNFSSNQNKVT